ncbi:MAG: hypothetical protein V8Q54_03115 [Alistipes senegalensis]
MPLKSGSAANSLQDPEQHRGVHVVAAGVHHALRSGSCTRSPFRSAMGRASMSARRTTARRSPGRLAASRDAGQYAGGCDPAVLDAQLRELLLDECRRAVLPERELGMRMQVAPKFDRIHFFN